MSQPRALDHAQPVASLDPRVAPGYVLQVFGLGFGEMIVIGIVLLLVVGPRELPKLLRTVGQGIRKLRGLSTELRSQSGIDDIIRDEGLKDDIDAIRSLSRGRIVEGLVREASKPAPRRAIGPVVVPTEELKLPASAAPNRDDEYPLIGADSYGALTEDAKPADPSEPDRTAALLDGSGPKGPDVPPDAAATSSEAVAEADAAAPTDGNGAAEGPSGSDGTKPEPLLEAERENAAGTAEGGA